MARVTSFNVSNFKGINSINISLYDKSVRFPVVMLLGLNESGKTTILESISNFVSRNAELDSMFAASGLKRNVNDFIPLARLSNFNDAIAIKAKIELDDDDVSFIKEYCAGLGHTVVVTSISRSFSVDQLYNFKDSVFSGSENQWSFTFQIFKGKSKVKKIDVKPLKPSEKGEDLWRLVIQQIRSRVPNVSYFPTFIVDIPDRIYLGKVHNEAPSCSYLRSIIKEIFEVEGSEIDVDKHVIGRISEFKAENGNKFDGQKFASSHQRRLINAVFQKFSAELSREIIGSWKKIFNRPLNASSINVRWDVDVQNNDMPFIGIDISDGNESYKVSERSLGFKWFFSFLLFTKFKQKSSSKTIFLFDEPASNLHARAQQELMSAFSQVAERNQIIFSTHSHHMIEPAWLNGAYVVENKAIDFDEEGDDVSKFGRHTDIIALKYRTFASRYPSRSSYFQPIIEKLEYIPPNLIGEPPFIIVEGISDYFVFKAVADEKEIGVSLTPGSGAGSSGPLISLLMGRGLPFGLILDGDKAGDRAAQRYKDTFSLSDLNVIVISKFDEKLKGASLESILDESTISKVCVEFGVNELNKKEMRLYLSELYARGSLIDFLSDDVKSTVAALITAARDGALAA